LVLQQKLIEDIKTGQISLEEHEILYREIRKLVDDAEQYFAA